MNNIIIYFTINTLVILSLFILNIILTKNKKYLKYFNYWIIIFSLLILLIFSLPLLLPNNLYENDKFGGLAIYAIFIIVTLINFINLIISLIIYYITKYKKSKK